jgi:arylsulfatase A-like enzyme
VEYTIEEAARSIALRQDYWKYITPINSKHKDRNQLYNLKNDIGEKNNVISQHPEIAKQMHDLLMKLFHSQEGIRQETK